jgi:hypothetical protein
MKKLYAILSSALFFSFSVKLNGQCTSSVPYYEGFQGITSNNQLPPCWVASNPSVTCLTSTLHQASFYYNPAGVNYFYTNGLQLYSGIIYSVSLFYKTDNSGSQNWTDLSILRNSSQTATGASTIASTNGPAMSSPYKLLDAVFTVPSSGVYYLAIRGTGNMTATSQYLYWDDLSVTIPCNANSSNSPSLNLNATTGTICAGDSAHFTISGAHTYTWGPNNSNDSTIWVKPTSTTYYVIAGTNTLTGCAVNATVLVVVNPTPNVFIVPNTPTVCAGSPAVLTAIGGGVVAWSWSNGPNVSTTTVNPVTTTSYSVVVTNQYGCSGMATQTIGVKPLPLVTAAANTTTICIGESATLTGSGASTYVWNDSATLTTSQIINVSPTVTTVYTLTGTDGNSCTAKTAYTLNVANCDGPAGVRVVNADGTTKVMPNPSNGIFKIETNGSVMNVKLFGLDGREVSSEVVEHQENWIDMRNLANGMYYVEIRLGGKTEVFKIVKQ